MQGLPLAATALAASAAAGLSWGLVEARAFTVRRLEVAVLPAGSTPVRVLHLSDIHLTPRQRAKARWVAGLARLEPDLVVNTGDNLAHEQAVPVLLDALGSLLDVPGVYVHGSNDYFAPRPKNPFAYFAGPSSQARKPASLPTAELERGFDNAGWLNLNNARGSATIRGTHIDFAGLDDPHLRRDRALASATTGRPVADLRIGVVHAPYARALGALSDDGAQLILAGHTHGGQVCVPGYGALVTNCDLDRARAKGLSGWPRERPDRAGGEQSAWLHVSAGVGTSPYAPVRFACRPEATLLTLTPALR